MLNPLIYSLTYKSSLNPLPKTPSSNPFITLTHQPPTYKFSNLPNKIYVSFEVYIIGNLNKAGFGVLNGIFLFR